MPAFDHPSIQWRRVSPKYVVRQVVEDSIGLVIMIAITVGIAFIDGWWWLIPAAFAVPSLISLLFVARRTRAIGYALRDDDLVFRRGLFFARMVAVPYGRLQMVDLRRGPIDRMLGLASLKTLTASPSSAVEIPGLPEAEAQQLRDHLIRVAETRRAGL